jgi:peptidoglycan-associated lipoprotein
MRKGIWTVLALLLVLPGLLTTVACGKKKVSSEPGVSQGAGDNGDEARRQAEEQRLREQALKDEAAKNAQASKDAFSAEDVYFEFDSAVLSADAQEVLKQKAQWMESNSNAMAVVEGHCDERGTNEYNLALGDRRATAAKVFMTNLGISDSRLSTVSYGEEKPVDTGTTEDAYAKNRRDHFELK